MKEVNSWSDITVGQYQEMMLVQSDSEITKFIETISIALDTDPQTIRQIPLREYKDLQAQMAFIKEEPLLNIVERFEFKGVRYGLEPDMQLISTGVFLDAEHFKNDPIPNLHRTLALIYRPIVSEEGEDWQIQGLISAGFEKRADLFKELSIETVLGATFFFSNLGVELSIHFLESLSSETTLT